MPAETIKKLYFNRACEGDIAYGLGTVTQIRGGVTVTLNEVNLANLPIDEFTTLQDLNDAIAELNGNVEGLTNIVIVADNIDSVITVGNDLSGDNFTGTVAGSITFVDAVGGNINEVITVAGMEQNIADVLTEPLKSAIIANSEELLKTAILDAESNASSAANSAGASSDSAIDSAASATEAELQKWEAIAERLTADSWASEPTDTFVKIYTSNGDSSFAITSAGDYSAKHFKDKAEAVVGGGLANFSRYGRVSGLEATTNGSDDTKFDVAAGEYYIGDTLVTYGGSTANSTGLTAGNSLLVVGFDANGLVTKTSTFTDTELLTHIEVGALLTGGGATTILAIGESYFQSTNAIARLAARVKNYEETKFDKTAGVISENAIPFHLDIAGGTLNDGEMDSKIVPATTSIGGIYATRVAGNIVNTTMPSLVLDHTKYDNGTDMVAATTDRYLSFTVIASSRTGTVYVLSPQNEYVTFSEALNCPCAVNPILDSKGLDVVPIAKIICKVGATKIEHIEDVRNVIDKFRKRAVTTDGVNNLSSFGNGSIVESIVTTVTSDGSEILFNFTDPHNSHLTCQIDEQNKLLANGSIALIPGLDTLAQRNYVYAELVEGEMVVKVSTSGFPDTPICHMADVTVKTAIATQTDGPVAFQAWINHMSSEGGKGHLSGINFWIRQQNSTYLDGLDLTTNDLDVEYATLPLELSDGGILQLHKYGIPSYDISTDDAFVINDNAETYKKISDLITITADSTGASLSDRRYSLVVIVGANEDSNKVYVNLPDGSYGGDTDAIEDLQKYTNYKIPTELKGKTVLAYRITVKHKNANSSFKILSIDDLRDGVIPQTLNADDFRFTTPTLSGGATIPEQSLLVVTIDNYDALATYTYNSSSGNAVQNGGTIEITAGSVNADEPGHTLTVTAYKDGFLESNEAIHEFTVTNVPLQNDDDTSIQILAGGDWNGTNFPILVNGVLDGNLTATSDNAAATSEPVDKTLIDADGDWTGIQAGAYVESELVNRLADGDVTDIIVNDEVVNGDVLYIGDGTDEAELIASSVVDNLNGTFTLPHNQVFTPTYTCSQDNVSVPISFNAGVNYKTADKLSGTLIGTVDRVNDEFETVIYDGIETGQTINLTNISSNVDFVWQKGRDVAYNNVITDSIRGATKSLSTNNTTVEATANHVAAFGTGEFTMGVSGTANNGGDKYVAWCASLPNKSGVLGNTDGSIASTTMSNSFMSVVGYEGNNSTSIETVGHGLSSTPRLSIVKSRDDTTSWCVQTFNMANNETMLLQDTLAITDSSGWSGGSIFNGQPTDTTFSINSVVQVNSAESYIAYCFTSVEGKCKVGSYTGTGATGNIVDCGFEPAWVMIKCTNIGTTGWTILDYKRNSTSHLNSLFPNASDVENTVDKGSFESNGFIIDNTGDWLNASGGEYIFLAIAKDYKGDHKHKEILEAFQAEEAHQGKDLVFKVEQKEINTKTDKVFVELTELGV